MIEFLLGQAIVHFALQTFGIGSALANSDFPAPVVTPLHTDTPMVPSVQIDPLNSPYPIPWNWVMATLAEASSSSVPLLRYYRTPSLISPSGEYAAYSRIQMRVMPDFTQSRVNSVMFVENLNTGDLQTVMAASPFADNPFMGDAELPMQGTIAVLIPIAWSASSDRILAREFESAFGTDIASDFAVVWDRPSNTISTIAPTGLQYTNAILLGWSQMNPNRVLFRAGNLGDDPADWPMMSVDFNGQTTASLEDQPITYGQTMTNIWAGPQAFQR